VEIPVPHSRWQNTTHAILQAWRHVTPWEVRAEVFDPRNVVAALSYDPLDYPERVDEG